MLEKKIFKSKLKNLSHDELKEISQKLRLQLIKMAHSGKAAHLGSSLSCIDIIVALYCNFLNISSENPSDPCRDRFILSKGHAISSLYAVLAELNFFNKLLLSTFNQNGSSLPEHPSPKCVPGLEMASGSLGHGLSVGIGHALASKINKIDYKTFVLLSDGECNEGSVWEAAQFAPAKKLDNIIALIDYNKWQATGKSDEVLSLSPLKEKWSAFGWETYEINGHDFSDLCKQFENIYSNQEKPIAIICNTIKGKGISFMEDDNNWHYRIPTEEEILKAKEELGV